MLHPLEQLAQMCFTRQKRQILSFPGFSHEALRMDDRSGVLICRGSAAVALALGGRSGRLGVISKVHFIRFIWRFHSSSVSGQTMEMTFRPHRNQAGACSAGTGKAGGG